MSPSSRIYNMVRALAESGQCRPADADDDDEATLGMELSMKKIKDRVIAKGFTEDQWQTAVMEYTNLDVCFSSPPSYQHPANYFSRFGKLLAMVHVFFLSSLRLRIWPGTRSLRWSRRI